MSQDPDNRAQPQDATDSRPDDSLQLPHERDQSTGQVAREPDPVTRQAKRDLDAGQVDTDMHASPGLDAERRKRLVPAPTQTEPAPPGQKRRPAD